MITDFNKKIYFRIVFVLNKAERDDFSPHNIKDMTDLLERTMRESKLKYKGIYIYIYMH